MGSCTIGLDISALDASFKAHAARGIGRYVSELKRYFERQSDALVSVDFFDHTLFRSPKFLDSLIEKLPVGRNTVRQQILYPLQLDSRLTSRFDGLHFPAHMDAPSWSCKNYLLTVLDLIPLICVDLYRADRPGWRYRLARWLELRAIRNASRILAISQTVADDVNRLLGIPYERIAVTPLGVDEKFFAVEPGTAATEVRKRYGVPAERKVVLYVGGIDPRKNVAGLLSGFAALRERCRSREKPIPVLVIAGKIEGDREYPKLEREIARLDLSRDVVITGYVEDTDLLSIYAMSSAFYFPSLYEGFGLTPLEAMAAGVPVVSSSAPAMPEVLGDGAILVAPEKSEEAAEEIYQILFSPERTADLRKRGRERARRFTWERTGVETLRAYRHFAEGLSKT